MPSGLALLNGTFQILTVTRHPSSSKTSSCWSRTARCFPAIMAMNAIMDGPLQASGFDVLLSEMGTKVAGKKNLRFDEMT